MHSFYDIEPLREALHAGTVLITPNFRLARRIKLAWGHALWSQGERSWPTPRVMSLEHWWLHCLEEHQLDPQRTPLQARVASEQQQVTLWQQCIRDNPRSAALLRPAAAAQLARSAWQNLLLWQVDCEAADIAPGFRETADGSLFLQWLSEYRKRSKAAGLLTLPEIVPDIVVENSEENIRLLEFDELPPLYEEQLRRQGISVQHHSHRGDEASTRLLACDSPGDELQLAACWAREKQETGSVAILVPDLAQRRQSVERTLREAFDCPASGVEDLPVNISAGIPLQSCPPVRTALELLALPFEDCELEILVGILHSRYRPQQEREAELGLLRQLYRRGSEWVRPEELRYWCEQQAPEQGGLELGRQLLKVTHNRELQGSRAPSAWTGLFSDTLQLLGWPGAGPLNSLEYQQVEHFYSALEQLGELDSISAHVDYRSALQLLRQLCSANVFQPQTGESPVQVLGLLEAAGLQFDHLWICGMHSEAWPQAAAPNPFIPLALQRSRGMPHADANREQQYAVRQLARFRQSCGEMVASYARLEDDIPRQPSPLLGMLDCELAERIDSPTRNRWATRLAGAQAERISDDTAPPLTDAEREALRGGSSILADQSRCPFRAFARHRLGADPLPETGIGLDPAQRGNLLHDALYRLWDDLGSQQALLTLSDEERSSAVTAACEAAVAEFARRYGSVVGRQLLQLEQQRLQLLLGEWLQLEMQREPFEVLEREAEHQLEIEGLSMTLRVDRLDGIADGALVIDYKSGSTSFRTWLGPRPEQPQLPLYSLALGENVAGLAFARIRHGDSAWEGLARSAQGPGISDELEKKTARLEQPVNSWEEQQALWSGNLRDLASSFRYGDALVAPLKSETCAYCGLQALCRVESSDS